MDILEIRAAQSAAVERIAAVVGVYYADTIVTKYLTADEFPATGFQHMGVYITSFTRARVEKTLMSWRRFERSLLATETNNIFMHTQVQRIRLAFVESLADIVESTES